MGIGHGKNLGPPRCLSYKLQTISKCLNLFDFNFEKVVIGQKLHIFESCLLLHTKAFPWNKVLEAFLVVPLLVMR